MKQLDAFPTVARARRRDPDTSHDAAASIRMSDMERRVYRCLGGKLGAATSFEIAAFLGLSLVTVSPRLKPLVEKGLVRDSGRRKLGETGRPRIIWECRSVG
jgi:predicted ArsR family transcriptional regulator